MMRRTTSYSSAINLPHFLFVAVIVAVFMGLTVSAEELFRDRLMRKREGHLQLSWGAYLGAKTAVLFAISAIQTLLFAAVSHPILGLPGHFAAYAFTLFTVAACECVRLGHLLAVQQCARYLSRHSPVHHPTIDARRGDCAFADMHPRIARSTEAAWPAQFMISRWGLSLWRPCMRPTTPGCGLVFGPSGFGGG